jgi:hypothetical protein
MAESTPPQHQRVFHCAHCHGKIMIPRDLPPTTGPCPLCGGIITSPSQEIPAPLLSPIPAYPAPVEEPVLVVQPTLATDDSNATRPKRSIPEEVPERPGFLPAILVLLGLAAVGTAIIWYAAKESKKTKLEKEPQKIQQTSTVNEAHYLRVGWQKDARQVLNGFISATTVAEKLPYILNASSLSTKMEEYYGGSPILDADTPAEAFTVYELSESDTQRGLFVMIYDQPARLEMKEYFRPLASLEVQYGLQEADLLLSTVANTGNFATEPLRILAFFKRTPEGLKMDWEIFTQTKYRTLRNFAELPDMGQSKIFRVLITEDVPEQGQTIPGHRTYHVIDPANNSDGARVNVKIDSETGKALAPINWRGSKENQPVTQSATVELTWAGTKDAPILEISRLLCWEFLGLGGKETLTAAPEK